MSLVVLGGVVAKHVLGNAKLKDPTQQNATQSEKLAQAEAACDRVIARMHQALDLHAVIDEMWVTDPILQDRLLRKVFGGFETNAAYDPRLAEQVVTSSFTALYLLFQYEMDHKERPKELQERLDRLDAAQTRARSKARSSDLAIADLQESIDAANRASAFLISHLTPGHFDSALYKLSVQQDAALGKRHGFPRVLDKDTSLGLDQGAPIYEVYREGFCWDFIEENGQFRLMNVRLQFMSLGYL